jgi:hypothetical protein
MGSSGRALYALAASVRQKSSAWLAFATELLINGEIRREGTRISCPLQSQWLIFALNRPLSKPSLADGTQKTGETINETDADFGRRR